MTAQYGVTILTTMPSTNPHSPRTETGIFSFRLLTMVFVGLSCFSQGTKSLSFPYPYANLGRVQVGNPVTHVFIAQNNGSGPVHLLKVNPTCGCTSVLVGKSTLLPGETTEVQIKFDPSSSMGLVHKAIVVESDSETSPRQTLFFDAEVIREISLSQEELVFSNVPAGFVRKGSIKIESNSGAPFHVSEVEIKDCPHLSCRLRPEGKAVWLDVAFDASRVSPSQLVGTDRILVRTTSPKAPLLVAVVKWDIDTALAATPNRVAWTGAAGDQRETFVTIKDIQGRPFRIKGWKSTSELISVNGITKEAKSEHKVVVVLGAGAKAGIRSERLLILLEHSSQSELELRICMALS